MCVVDIIVEVFRRAEFEVLMETCACRSVECVTWCWGMWLGLVIRRCGADLRRMLKPHRGSRDANAAVPLNGG
jgi:hypothetical protein